MKTEHITVTLQSVRSAAQQKQAGDIPDGQHTHSVRGNAPIVGIPVPTVSQMELVPSAVTPVHTAIPKRCIPMKMFQQDIISIVMLQAVIPADRQSQVGDTRAGTAALMQHRVRLPVLTVNIHAAII